MQTAYLIAELVMIPFSGFLAQAISTRWLFTISAGLFTLCSALCGLAWDIRSMIVFRALQGFVGGAMVPTVFATGFSLFSGPERALIPAILGMVSVLAPTLGPIVGGWLTDQAGWRWIFYVNIVPGIAVTILALTVIRGVDKPSLLMLNRIDCLHLAPMTVFLGGLEYVLEEDQRLTWFSDPTIATAAWLSFVALLFIERSFYSTGPIVKLTPFRTPSFAFACIFNLVIGFGVYSSTYLVPVFLGRVRGYNSLDIGTTVFVTGLSQIFGTVVAARLSQRLDPRIMIVPGLCLFTLSMWMTSNMTTECGFQALLLPQLVRGVSVMLCIVPGVSLALSGFGMAELRSASGLFNLVRNLGGAIGIAVVNVWLTDQSRIEVARMSEALGEPGRAAPAFVSALAAKFGAVTSDPAHAMMLAKGELARLVGRHALTLGFDEVFRIMAWMFVAALVIVQFCRPASTNTPAAASEAH